MLLLFSIRFNCFLVCPRRHLHFSQCFFFLICTITFVLDSLPYAIDFIIDFSIAFISTSDVALVFFSALSLLIFLPSFFFLTFIFYILFTSNILSTWSTFPTLYITWVYTIKSLRWCISIGPKDLFDYLSYQKLYFMCVNVFWGYGLVYCLWINIGIYSKLLINFLS